MNCAYTRKSLLFPEIGFVFVCARVGTFSFYSREWVFFRVRVWVVVVVVPPPPLFFFLNLCILSYDNLNGRVVMQEQQQQQHLPWLQTVGTYIRTPPDAIMATPISLIDSPHGLPNQDSPTTPAGWVPRYRIPSRDCHVFIPCTSAALSEVVPLLRL